MGMVALSTWRVANNVCCVIDKESYIIAKGTLI